MTKRNENNEEPLFKDADREPVARPDQSCSELFHEFTNMVTHWIQRAGASRDRGFSSGPGVVGENSQPDEAAASLVRKLVELRQKSQRGEQA